jgi:hypothetical protein
MILISHRGNLRGPKLNLENHPEYIDVALSQGYDVEVDVWLSHDNKIYTGHDEPTYLISEEWLTERISKLWVHCKNFAILNKFINDSSSLNFFWHNSDSFTLTSTNVIWTYPGNPIDARSILVLPENSLNSSLKVDISLLKPLGVCSDFIEDYVSK